MDFNQWLIRRGNIRRATVLHYAGAVYGTISRMVGHPVYEITDMEEFDKLYADLVARPDFADLDRRGNRMYSSALKKYRAFLTDAAMLAPFVDTDLDDIKADTTLDETEKLRLISARVGQGKYRSELIRLWDGRCSVTGYTDSRVLIASHIKPWFAASNQERLDPFNGFLLTPNLDKAFDIGLITFNPKNKGRIVFSSAIVEPEALGINDNMFVPILNEKVADYLTFHKKEVFIR